MTEADKLAEPDQLLRLERILLDTLRRKRDHLEKDMAEVLERINRRKRELYTMERGQ